METNTATTTATANAASSLATIDASATTGGIEIAAGDQVEIGTSAFYTTYAGLTIDGGSGSDFIYNGATSGARVDGSGKGDVDAVEGVGSYVTVGAGSSDTVLVGLDLIGATITDASGPAFIGAAASIAGASVNDVVTFGAGATATLSVAKRPRQARSSTRMAAPARRRCMEPRRGRRSTSPASG